VDLVTISRGLFSKPFNDSVIGYNEQARKTPAKEVTPERVKFREVSA